METLILPLLKIYCQQHPSFNPQTFLEKWSDLTLTVIIPIYSASPNPKEFVSQIHTYFHHNRGISYQSSSFDPIEALLGKSGGNCVSHSLLILMASVMVNLFPDQIIGGFVEGHMFITEPSHQDYFEPTQLPHSGYTNLSWEPISTLYQEYHLIPSNDLFLCVTQLKEIIELYACETIATLLRTDHRDQAFLLLSHYPNNWDPSAIMNHLCYPSSTLSYIYRIRDCVNLINRNNLEVAYLNLLLILLGLLGKARPFFPTSEHDLKGIGQRIVKMLQRVSSYNPHIQVLMTEIQDLYFQIWPSSH